MQNRIALTKNDERNIHSQYGEDGILERIFAVAGAGGRRAVEFGAWDGIHLSNTANLRAQGWSTVLIEGDEARFARLESLRDERTLPISAFVEPAGANSLDALLDRAGIGEIDLLCIDIDGGDLDILQSLKRTPRVICIEFNPGIPPPYRFRNPPGAYKGSSLAAIAEVGEQKSYALVYATYCNAFLVRTPDCGLFQCHDSHSAYHLNERRALGFMFDGEFSILGGGAGPVLKHPWSTVPVFVPRLPKILLGWPPSKLKVILSYLFCALAAPLFYVWELAKEILRQAVKASGARSRGQKQ